MLSKPKGLFLLDTIAFEKIYGEEQCRKIQSLVSVQAAPWTASMIKADPLPLADVEVIFSGWGCPQFTDEFLQHAPNLKVVFYGAGSIRPIVTDAFWGHGIKISTAYEANDIPVAEFTLAQILLGLKGYWQYGYSFIQTGRWYEHLPAAGIYGSTVGLISLGMIGWMVAQKLKMYDVHVIAYDPYVSPETAAGLGVTMVSLAEIFKRADVVSLHAPWLPETEGMIRREHFAAMKSGATFINTARGAIVRENEMVEVLSVRPDLFALLDVTYPEPPHSGSPLLSLPNVIITPHIAGANTNECKRNGSYVVDELERYLRGEPLHFAVTKEKAAIMA
jgi:phosphoglycerate dehydrogenase-like enzyme